MRHASFAAVGLLIALGSTIAAAQTIDVRNPSFEQGTGDKVDGWALTGPAGGGRVLTEPAARAIVATGKGADTSSWRSGPLALEPRALYRLAFRAKRLSGTGSAITGPAFCNRDIGFSGDWTSVESIFAAPANLTPDQTCLRFGQWHMNGEVAFDDVQLCRAVPVYARLDQTELGEGEILDDAEYTFHAPFRGESRNHARALYESTCTFNTDRWVFSAGNSVTYRHELRNRMLAKPAVTVGVTWHAAGRLIVEASADGKAWREIGALGGVSSAHCPIPVEFLPAPAIWVRLRAAPAEGKPHASLQVGAYSFAATLTEKPGPSPIESPKRRFIGATQFFAIHAVDPRAKVSVFAFSSPGTDGGHSVTLDILRRGRDPLLVRPTLQVQPEQGEPTVIGGDQRQMFPFRPFVTLTYPQTKAGRINLTITLGPDSPFKATTTLTIPPLHDASYGHHLPQGFWWCSSGHKVSRLRPPPPMSAKSAAIEISLAANEWEAAQLVGGRSDVDRFSAKPTDLKSEDGGIITAANIEILRVGYVNVAHPTDSSACVGSWPDPLLPLNSPAIFDEAGNHPLWIRVKAPKGTPPGDYSGAIVVGIKKGPTEVELHVPLKVHVYAFELPDRLTCETAFGFSPSMAWRYHNVTDTADRRVVLDKYWKSFADHHISPYDPCPLDPIKVTWPRRDLPVDQLKPTFDFERWDREMARVRETFHFGSFRLNLHGMGGGTFHQRVDPELLGYREGSPQYEALLSSYLGQFDKHLREKNLQDFAYAYWFDEPDPKDYAFVTNGFAKLKKHAPSLRRMLTEQVEEALAGGPNIWCPVSNDYDHARAEQRRQHGEKFWWYVCCGPKAPYCTLFIDHPATELRAWLWQTWQRKIGGILVWEVNYWTSPTAYPDPKNPQNPYADPMGWVSGYGVATGTKQAWGNGDGRFIYPPEAAADGKPAKPVLDGPVDSIRWEMLRDGLEDYEYLVILRTLIAQKGASLSPERRAELERLLEVPVEITKDMTTFTTDPAPIESRREAIARAIEGLRK